MVLFVGIGGFFFFRGRKRGSEKKKKKKKRIGFLGFGFVSIGGFCVSKVMGLSPPCFMGFGGLCFLVFVFWFCLKEKLEFHVDNSPPQHYQHVELKLL